MGGCRGVCGVYMGCRRETHANNALRANQLDQLVLDAALCVALAVGLEVAQVAHVALLIARRAVGLVVRVD